METDWYKKEDHVILSELGSDRKRGLSSEKAAAAKSKYGLNTVVGDNSSTAWNIFKRQFENSIVYILVFAATISVMIGKKTEYLVIMCIVGFIVFLSFIEEYKASKDMQSLRKLAPKKARVIRDGLQQEILAIDLVPGDILVLRKGDIVGADARLLEVQDMSIDESTLTGESYAVSKETKAISKTVPLAQRTNMVFSSTHISRGNGLAVVVGTGAQTEIGLITTLVKDIKEEETPLQKRLDKLSLQVSLWTIVVSVIIVIIGVIKGEPIGEMALLAIAVAVAGIPESLPTVVVVCLALGMKRMAKSGAIVKRLAAVETLGTCTVICTDKTGTLTQNHMTVERLILPSDVVRVTADPENPQAVFLKNDSVIDHTEDK
ncbi:MAG TPA: HAD-IC family P-type ATPase, partial [Acidobacteriota bacterium]|nr:HAD-IC family P-type ATPase [Acidobacteriota bacterium]